LRTCLYNDEEKGLQQRLIPYELIHFNLQESLIQNNDELNEILLDEEINCNHFNLVQDQVLRCHFIHHQFDRKKKVLLLNFHHTVFDEISEFLFLNGLCEVYSKGKFKDSHEEIPNYIDYSLWERKLDLLKSISF
jgi:NRPS condensation-like uncharacterized protein